ncbi:MAG: hypothetical protein MZV64_59560 [Ignavibacteriales bacterium]|nr:hypothetical protein [Ignavibacteriales bacterium]
MTMETTIAPRSLGQPGFLIGCARLRWRSSAANGRSSRAIPSWIIALFIWPLIFPMMYILTARALSGSRWQRTGSLHRHHRRDRLHRLHHRRHHGLDVAEHRAVGRGLCAAQRTDARHARIQLALPHLEVLLPARADRSADRFDGDVHRHHGVGVRHPLRRPLERQSVDDRIDDAGGDPRHLRIGVRASRAWLSRSRKPMPSSSSSAAL